MVDSLNESFLDNKQGKKILQCFVSDAGDGVTESIYNNYQFMDKDVIHYDFLYIKGKPWFSGVLEEQGAKFIKISSLKHPFAYFNDIRKIVRDGKYDAVYFNLSFGHIWPVLAAHFGHAPKIIVHAHASSIDRGKKWKRLIFKCYHVFSRFFWSGLIDYKLACSKLAGEFLFSRKNIGNLHLVHNAIDLKNFEYSEKIRNDTRTKLGISPNTFLVGHIGRFSYQKNHEYLIRIFTEIVKENKDSVLLLVGDGPDRSIVTQLVNKLGLQRNVKFLGFRKDVNRLLMAMDVFILPSRFEGLGIVLIEAQATGLPCLASDNIPSESKVSPLITYLSINDSPKEWAKYALKNLHKKERSTPEGSICTHGYDNRSEAMKLQTFLLQNI